MSTGKGFMKGVRLAHFLDTVAEWHALVQGFSEVMCPWPPRHRLPAGKLLREINEEYHYYVAGRVLGILAWFSIGGTIYGMLS
ncbi:MAG: hypothetical protein ACNA7X_04320 [Dehalococcoidia bacterium]